MIEPQRIRSGKNYEKEQRLLTGFTSSLVVDQRLFRADIEVNIAYCDALFHGGILTRLETERIKNGLQAIFKRAEYDRNYFIETDSENIHSFVITRLVQLIGETGKKLLIGRNEYEQSVTVLRLWLRRKIEEISRIVKEFQTSLIEVGERWKKAILPVFTNLQKGKPILWAHWCHAYFEMFARDRERLDEVWRRVNVSPFGAGTSFEIDREEIAAALRYEGVSANGFDTVSDNDFLIEFVNSCALLMTHLSRLARDIMIYNSDDFNFIEIEESAPQGIVSTKHSNNFRVMETLIRKANSVFGCQAAILSASNIPPSNLREEMRAVFETIETVETCLSAGNSILKILNLNEQKAGEIAARNYSISSELTDYLLKKDMPLEAARDTSIKITSFAVSKNKEINEFSLDELKNFSAKIEYDVFQAINLEQSLANENQIGGTAPERVWEALENARITLERDES